MTEYKGRQAICETLCLIEADRLDILTHAHLPIWTWNLNCPVAVRQAKMKHWQALSLHKLRLQQGSGVVCTFFKIEFILLLNESPLISHCQNPADKTSLSCSGPVNLAPRFYVVPHELAPFRQLFADFGAPLEFNSSQYVAFLADLAVAFQSKPLPAREMEQALVVAQVEFPHIS